MVGEATTTQPLAVNVDVNKHTPVIKKDVASTLEKGKPIEKNVFNVPAARIVPDNHGGVELQTGQSRPLGKSPQLPFSEFMADKVEGEIMISAGDVFDRGADSWGSAEAMMEMVGKGEAVWNYGNHEFLFMAAMNGNAEAFQTWFLNGGGEMMKSAGVANPTMQEAMKNPNLQRLNNFLRQNGKAYTIVDNVLVTHAGVIADPATGALKNVVINGVDFGNGLDAMDKIQAEIRNGNNDVINWLANHGGTDQMNPDNPFWVREQGFQDVVADPLKASKLREQLNGQAKARGTNIELIVVGHTPSMGDKAFATQSLDEEGRPKQRFLFADNGYYEQGLPRVVKLRVNAQAPTKVAAIYEDPRNKARVEGSSGKVLEATYDMDQAIVAESQITAEMRTKTNAEIAADILTGAGEKNEADEVAKRGEATKNQLAAEAGIDMPELSHQMLEILSTKGNIPQALQEYGQKVQSEAGDNKAKQALGIDIELAGLQQEYKEIEELMPKAKGKKFGELEERRNELVVKYKLLAKAREANPAPNALVEMATAMGADPKAIEEGGPFTAMSDLIGTAIANGEVREGLIARLQAGVESGMFKQEDVDIMKEFLGSEAVAKFVKDKAWLGVKVGGGIGLFLLLMMWMSSKEKQGGPMG